MPKGMTDEAMAAGDPRLNETVIDHLANRLAEALFRSGMGERHASSPQDYRDKVDAWDREHGPAEAQEFRGPLDEIAHRIQQISKRIMGMTGNLNLHADRVSGVGPMEPNGRRETDANAKIGVPAMQSIFVALDDLDMAVDAARQAADRNTNLA